MSSSDAHPFLNWVSFHKAGGRISLVAKDILLDTAAGKEFAIGVHEGLPILCYQEEHAAAIESIRWTAAAFLFNTNGRDWVLLSAKDIRIKGSTSVAPVPVRLFVPVDVGMLDVWKTLDAPSMHIGVLEMKKGKPEFNGSPFKSLPLKIIG